MSPPPDATQAQPGGRMSNGAKAAGASSCEPRDSRDHDTRVRQNGKFAADRLAEGVAHALALAGEDAKAESCCKEVLSLVPNHAGCLVAYGFLAPRPRGRSGRRGGGEGRCWNAPPPSMVRTPRMLVITSTPSRSGEDEPRGGRLGDERLRRDVEAHRRSLLRRRWSLEDAELGREE